MSELPDRVYITEPKTYSDGETMPGSWVIKPDWCFKHEYRRADLSPTLSAAMELPEVRELVETAQWARNRLEIIADESWHGDGRDLKRSIIGIFADFDKALADCGSQVPLSLAAIKEPKT